VPPTLADLFAQARDRGLPRYRTLSRAELEDALRRADGAGGEPARDEPVRVERDGPLALIVLDDRRTRNALGTATMAALEAAISGLEGDGEVRLVALAHAGPVFSSGAAIAEWDVLPDGGEALTTRGTALCDRLAALPVPVVALVGGHAVGGGAELALAADWRLMAPDAELRFVHAGLGLVPGFGGLGRLAALVGRGRALRAIACREAIGAEQALLAGLADEVVPARRQRARARELAEHVAGSDRLAVARAKVALTSGGRDAERAAFLASWPDRRLPR
jgi:enoyl-CoA hydratase/carnithine racemase